MGTPQAGGWTSATRTRNCGLDISSTSSEYEYNI